MVVDAAGNYTLPSTVFIVVKDGNLPPTGRIVEPATGRVNITTGTVLSFRAEGDDPEGDTLQFRWYLPDGTSSTINPISYRFDEVGDFYVSLATTDSHDNTDINSKLVYIVVQEPGEVEPPDAYIFFPFQATRIYQDESLFLRGLALEGTPSWTITDEATGLVARTLEEETPGRIAFPDGGLFGLRFRAEVLGVTSLDNPGNFLWVSVWQRDGNEPPTLDYKDEYAYFVRNGESVELEIVGNDPEGGSLRYFWVKDGVQLTGNGSKQTVTFDLQEDDFNDGLYYGSVRVQVLDEGNKAAIEPHSFLVYVYNNKYPPVARVNGLATAQTTFLALGETFPLALEVENPDQVPLTYSWAAIYQGEGGYFWEAEGAKPTSFTPNKTGVIFLLLHLNSADGTTAGVSYLGFIHVYDPTLLPQPRITKPNQDLVYSEPGLAVEFAGYAIEPNFLSGLTGYPDALTTVTNTLTWTVTGEDGLVDIIKQNGPIQLRLQEPGAYIVSLNSENNIGLAGSVPARVTLLVGNPPGDQGYEPNDTRETASPLQIGNYGELAIGSEDPIDWYSFQMEKKGSLLELEIDLRNSEIAAELTVFQGTRIVTSVNLAAGKSTPFSFVGGDAGDYFLRLATTGQETLAKAGLSFGLGLEVSVPTLTFPYIRQDMVETTELTIVNPTGSKANVTLISHDSEGEVLAEHVFVLPPKGQLSETVDNLFPGSTLGLAWVHVLSDHNILGMATTIARDRETAVAEWAATSGLDELVVPHIAQLTDQWYTQTAVANPSDNAVSAYFSAQAGQFEIPDLAKANGGVTIDFQAFFGGTLPSGAEWGAIVEAEAKPSLGGIELFGTRQGSPRQAALRLTNQKFKNPNFVYQNRDLYFPHVAKDINTFWTGIAFVNTAVNSEQVRLIAYDDLGAELASEAFDLAPFEKRVGLARGFFEGLASDAPVSWIRLETSGAIAGFELFGDNTGDDQRLAGFPAVRGASKEVFFLKILHDEGQSWTGIAAVNLSPDQTATLIYEAYAADGSLLARVENRRIGPLRKEVIPVQDIFGGSLPEGLAWIKLNSSQPLAAFQLFGDNDGKFMAGTTAQ